MAKHYWSLVRFLMVAVVLTASCSGSGDTGEPPPTEIPSLITAGPTSAPTTATPPTALPTVPSVTEAPVVTTSVPSPTSTTSIPTTGVTTTVGAIEIGSLRLSFDVYEGQISGNDHVVVGLGTEVEIVVTADMTDEVHVHGYDHVADVSPGSAAVILFVADLPGIYEVELEGSGLTILELEVR